MNPARLGGDRVSEPGNDAGLGPGFPRASRMPAQAPMIRNIIEHDPAASEIVFAIGPGDRLGLIPSGACEQEMTMLFVVSASVLSERSRRWRLWALAFPSVSRKAEPVAHMIVTRAPVVAREGMDDKALRRGRRQPDRKAPVALAMSGSGHESLSAGKLAAEGADDQPKVETHRPPSRSISSQVSSVAFTQARNCRSRTARTIRSCRLAAVATMRA